MAVVPIVPTVVPTTETCLLAPLNANLTWLPLNASFVCVPLNDESTRPAGVIFTYPLALVALVVNDTLGVYVVLADRDDIGCAVALGRILRESRAQLGNVVNLDTDHPGFIGLLASPVRAGNQLMGNIILFEGYLDGGILIGGGMGILFLFIFVRLESPVFFQRGDTAFLDIHGEDAVFRHELRIRHVGRGEDKNEGDAHQCDDNPANKRTVHGRTSFLC